MGHPALRLVPALAAMLLALGLAGCDGNPATEAFNVSGYVTELGSGTPVRNATIIFTSSTLRQDRTSTNGSGFYEMVVETDSPFGQVRAEAEGYDPAEETVFFDSRDRRVDIELKTAIE